MQAHELKPHPPPPPHPGPAPAASTRLVLLVVGMGTLLSALSGSTINLALPALSRDLGITIHLAGWVVSAFLVSVTVLLLVAGRLGDLWGHRLVYLGGFALFGVASAACGLAGSFTWLVVARLVQGVGGAMVMATGPALLTTTFPASQRGRALGMVATATFTGLTIGPPLGGAILSLLSWRWIFYFNLPVAVVITALGLSFLPAPTRREPVPFDWGGTLLLVSGLPLLLLALSQGRHWGWGSPWTLSCGGAGLALLAAFAPFEARHRAPIMDPGLFRSRLFSGAVLSALGSFVSLFVPMILLPFFLLEGLRFPASRAGMILSAQPLVMALVASPAGRLSDRVGSRGLSVAGLLLLAAGLGGMSLAVGPATTQLQVALWLGVMGLGIGIFSSPNSSALMGAAPRAQQGVAGSVLAVARNLGMLVGVATGTAVYQMAGGLTGHRWIATDHQALSTALLAATFVCVASACAAALRGRPQDNPSA